MYVYLFLRVFPHGRANEYHVAVDVLVEHGAVPLGARGRVHGRRVVEVGGGRDGARRQRH